MKNIQAMHIAYRTEYLCCNLSYHFLIWLQRVHKAKKITSLADFGNYIQKFIVTVNLIKFNDVWMV